VKAICREFPALILTLQGSLVMLNLLVFNWLFRLMEEWLDLSSLERSWIS
jgi:hypothetical protein